MYVGVVWVAEGVINRRGGLVGIGGNKTNRNNDTSLQRTGKQKDRRRETERDIERNRVCVVVNMVTKMDPPEEHRCRVKINE